VALFAVSSGAPRVAIVNEAFACRFGLGRDAAGEVLRQVSSMNPGRRADRASRPRAGSAAWPARC